MLPHRQLNAGMSSRFQTVSDEFAARYRTRYHLGRRVMEEKGGHHLGVEMIGVVVRDESIIDVVKRRDAGHQFAANVSVGLR